MDDSGSSEEKLTEFVIDIDLFKTRQRREIEPLDLMKTVLINAFPSIFTHDGKTTRHLDLALHYFDNYLKDSSSSRSEQAEILGWNKKSKGAVANYYNRLEELGLVDAEKKQFNEVFLLKLYGEITIKIKYFEKLLEYCKDLVSFKYRKERFPKDLVEAPFTFSNSGELIIGLTTIFREVTEGEEIYLILKRGKTWSSDGVGEILKGLLEKLVKKKNAKLRVLTSELMEPKLLDFFKSLGEVIVDEKFTKIDKRWLYAAGFVVEVLKVKGANESPDELVGIIRQDYLNEKEIVARRMFEALGNTQ